MKFISIKFLIILLIGLSITFCLHTGILYKLKFPMFENHIVFAYVVNFFMAYGIFLFLYGFKNKHSESLGYFFMGGSIFKFLVYFIFFNSAYHIDNKVDKLEFFSFFIPYAISLIIEIITIIKILNNTESAAKK